MSEDEKTEPSTGQTENAPECALCGRGTGKVKVLAIHPNGRGICDECALLGGTTIENMREAQKSRGEVHRMIMQAHIMAGLIRHGPEHALPGLVLTKARQFADQAMGIARTPPEDPVH